MATVRAAVLRGVAERNRLVVQWRGLPRYVYQRLLRRGRHPWLYRVLREDALGAGMLGLIRAAEVWDESRARFPVFAFKVIARRMLKGSLLTGAVIRVPSTALCAGPECRSAALLALSCVSLEEIGGAEIVATSGEPAPGEQSGRSELPDAVAAALAGLDARDRELLRLCYVEGKTRASVARDWGVSLARVGQLLHRALARVRQEVWTVDIDSPW